MQADDRSDALAEYEAAKTAHEAERARLQAVFDQHAAEFAQRRAEMQALEEKVKVGLSSDKFEFEWIQIGSLRKQRFGITGRAWKGARSLLAFRAAQHSQHALHHRATALACAPSQLPSLLVIENKPRLK